MKPSLKLTLFASTIIGLTIASASSAQAQYYGRDDRSRAISSSPETGGYCDNTGCPDRFWKYPVHYGPVFFHGQWYRGPVYFRADRHGRQYWVSGGWHRDEWRGRRPAWARQSHDGPALGIDYYASHGFRVGDRGRQSNNADTRAGDVVSFQSFHRSLAPHGDWVYSDRWGEVWVPADVSSDFHPYYSGGHWANTREYGWLWVSSYDWGDIPFHYGRWVNDPDDGWMWIPGYVWSPGWVVWRSNDHYTGWMPMPPDEGFLRGNGDHSSFGISINFNRTDDYYGYSRWYGRGYDENRFASNWVFIGTGDLSDRDYRSHAVNRTNVVNVINSTTNVTNYTVVNNYIVNRSVDVKVVERAGGHPVPTVAAVTVIRSPALITTADTGRAVQVRMRETQPRGTGIVNSAPQPSQDVVRTLSTRPVERNGRPPVHLFTQTTVVNAPLKPATATSSTPNVIAPISGSPPPPPPSDTGGRNRDRLKGGQDNQGTGSPHGGAVTPPPQATPAVAPPANTNPPADRGGRNRDKLKGGQDNQGASGSQGGAVTPSPQTAPSVTPPANTNPPADRGGRNRDRVKGGQDNQGTGGSQSGAVTPPPEATPSVTPPAANNPPADTGGRNRDRLKGGQDNRGTGGSQSGAVTPPPQATPSVTPPANTNPPADRGGRNRDRLKGGQENQGVGGSQGGAVAPSPQTAPSVTPPAANNPPTDKGGRNRDRLKGGQDNQGAGGPQGGAVTLSPQTAPSAAPRDANTPPADKGKDHKKRKDGQDNQGTDPNAPQ